MALSIKHPEADHLARELAAASGETLTDAVVNALRERLIRQRGKSRGRCVRDELRAIRERCAQYPILDPRSAEEILGYDDHGLPR
ncbi:MAG: type II toxin-antitoxin system VapB family antitoxin [Bryobacteraceae bacterium]|jgi:antitoxin VapB